ncbi:MAG: serine hydrolase [Ignavibacteria bacterium]|nr:serine hydrolase [Ignavibacteria bacterium]
MKNFKLLLLSLLCLFVFVYSSQAQISTDKIDEVVDHFVKLDQFSGTILIAKDGNILYAKAFGEANKDHHVKNKINTKFNIGSIGKTFTGTAIMQLAEKGKLDVNDPVVKYLPDFPFGDKIKIHHLLTHTSGTFNYFAHPDFKTKMFSVRSVSDALPLIYDQKLVFDTPGEKFSYSNSGIVLLGAIIEKVTGQSYFSYIKENILDPLGMYDSRINFGEEIIENRSTGYMKTPTGKFKSNIYLVPPANADGGIETTVEDMLKFDQALYSNKLLSEEYKEKMFTPFLNDYAYCWRIDTIYGHPVIGHGGGAPGINAMFYRFVDDKLTMIIMSNYDLGTNNISPTLEAILFNQEYETPKPKMTEFLYTTMKEKGIDYTLDNAETLLKENGYDVRRDFEFNILGYTLIEEKLYDMAIAVFTINTKLFPNVANTFDSLAEAYMLSGDKESAIKYYKKALEVDPNFEHAKEMLEKLSQ